MYKDDQLYKKKVKNVHYLTGGHKKRSSSHQWKEAPEKWN
jgi:hypothetical protein